jgi:hypothetical protein
MAMKRRWREKLLARLNEVYANDATPSEKQLLKGIKARVHRTMKDRW